MAVVMIMPVMMNICNYQQSLVFSMHFGSSCPSLLKLESLSSNAGQGRRLRYEKENCIRPTYCYVHIDTIIN